MLDGTPATVGRALVERGLLDHRAFRGSVLRVRLTIAIKVSFAINCNIVECWSIIAESIDGACTRGAARIQ